jgi:hypothetical protein
MSKNLLSLIIVAILFLGILVSIFPVSCAAEPCMQAKSLSFLRNVVGINIEQYTTAQSVQYDDKLYDAPKKTSDMRLTSPESNFRVTCSYVKDVLSLVYLSDIEGNLKLAHPAAPNTVDAAKSFLVSYQQESGNAVYGKFAQMLNLVKAGGKSSVVTNDVKLEISNPVQNTTEYMWTYIDQNGVSAERKNVCLTYEYGMLKAFYNNWPLYSIVQTTNKLSTQQAAKIAIGAAQNYCYNVTGKDGVEQIISCADCSVSSKSFERAKLIYVNSVEQEYARGGDTYEMYLAWYVPLGFERLYPGSVSGLTVILWADSGEVCGINQMITNGEPGISTSVDIPSNATRIEPSSSVDQCLPTATESYSTTSQVPGLSAAMGMVFVSLGSCKIIDANGSRRRFSKAQATLLCALILLSILFIISPNMPLASATTAGGFSRIYSVPNATAYLGNDTANIEEASAAISLCGDIGTLYNNYGFYGRTSNTAAYRQDVLNSAYYDENNWDGAMVFHVGHVGGSSPYGDNPYKDNTNYPQNYISPSDVLQQTGLGKHFFVFLWICLGAPAPGSSPISNSMAAAWLHRDGSSGHPLLDSDGLGANSDSLGQCYISFFGYSPMVSGNVKTSGGYYYPFAEFGSSYPCSNFIANFYNYTVHHGYSVSDALNYASSQYFGCPYTQTCLNTGYNAWHPAEPTNPMIFLRHEGFWPSDYQQDIYNYNASWYPWPNNHMRVFGDSTIKLYEPLVHLSSVCDNHNQETLYPTFFLSGSVPLNYDVRVIPKYYTVSVSSLHNYQFDHFTLNGQNCGSNIPLFNDGDAVVAHYTWAPVYYNLAISSSGSGSTSPSGTQSCLSYTTQTVAAQPNEGYMHYWILDNDLDNPDFAPSKDVLMDNPHTLQANFVARPDYNFPSYVTSSEGTAYSVNRLVGVDNDGRYATLEGWGPYQNYGSITAHMYFSNGGHIYVYGYGWDNGPLYVYVSQDGNSWSLVSTPTVGDTPGWIDCGIYDAPFNYIKFTAEYENNVYNVYIDSVKVQPLLYHTLSIYTDGQGYTSPSGGPQYEHNTYAGVTAYAAPAWVFSYWTLDGNYYSSNPSINLYMTQQHSIVAHFVEVSSTYELTVDAYDAYLWDGYPYEPAVYVDGYYQGTAPVTLQVAQGRDHTVTVDSTVYSTYWGCDANLVGFSGNYYDGYVTGNGNSFCFSSSSSTTVNALYLPYWWMRMETGNQTESSLAPQALNANINPVADSLPQDFFGYLRNLLGIGTLYPTNIMQVIREARV